MAQAHVESESAAPQCDKTGTTIRLRAYRDRPRDRRGPSALKTASPLLPHQRIKKGNVLGTFRERVCNSKLTGTVQPADIISPRTKRKTKEPPRMQRAQSFAQTRRNAVYISVYRRRFKNATRMPAFASFRPGRGRCRDRGEGARGQGEHKERSLELSVHLTKACDPSQWESNRHMKTWKDVPSATIDFRISFGSRRLVTDPSEY